MTITSVDGFKVACLGVGFPQVKFPLYFSVKAEKQVDLTNLLVCLCMIRPPI